ncbi:MAG: hypothetical protein M3277_07130 [Actinomycetota bacterium]|nr:hypothetical protein [Actinomycetota bacterium]
MPSRSTAFTGSVRNNWDYLYLTLDSPGPFRVKITWDDISDDFDLIVFNTRVCPTDFAENHEIDRSQEDVSTSEEVTVPNTASQWEENAGEYTVRVIYDTVIDSGYRGTASFLEDVVHAAHSLSELEFGPATIVSAHFLGTEPMVTMERPLPDSLEGAIDPLRMFVDWPLTPRGQIGQVSRSLDGGRSFRLLFDPDCPERSRPGCLMGGGSDTMTEVDLIDGTLYFADQAAVIGAESLASSTDHGDTFPDTFPNNRQFAITSQITATDRQWLIPVNASVNDVPIRVGPRVVKAFLAYHVPFEGQYIHGIDEDGVPIPQPVPQLQQVVQSGHPRVDTSDGAGSGWIYQPYKELGAEGFVVRVATAHGSDYQFPHKWESTTVTTDLATNFPWLDIDSAGNAYLVWAAEDGAVYYSVSPIAIRLPDDTAPNDPTQGGRPGTFWTPSVRLTPEGITSSVFAEVVAGGPGRIAITYAGSKDDKAAGKPDLAPDTASWHAYAAVVTGAHQQGGPPVVTTGRVSHRPIHEGNICTAGLFCGLALEAADPEMKAADRSLAEMIDIGVDEDGRIGVVFTDNNNSLPWQDEIEKARPFVHFAKLSSGPSLFADESIAVAPPVDMAETERGDATWPNTASGKNLTAMDLRRAELAFQDGQIIARLHLPDSVADREVREEMMKDALESFEVTSSPIHSPERLQYMVRFSTDDDVYHLSMDYHPPTGSQTEGVTRFFGGRLDANDALRVGDSDSLTLVGAAYRDDGLAVEGWIDGDTLVIRANAEDLLCVNAQDVCVTPDEIKVFSVTGFAMGGPAEEDVGVFNPMRTVDATPPFDATLLSQPLQTTLTYTGDHEGKVGDSVAVSALLATADGSPLAGQTISFSRGGKEATAVTSDGSDGSPVGVASTTLHITGPPGSSLPVVVTFGGDDSFLPVSIEAPFTAHTGSLKAPRGAI